MMFPRLFALTATASALVISGLPMAAAPSPSFTEPEQAGPDFAIQGEYVGEESAAQVIALGGGKFHIVGWSKGLPGAAAEAEKKVELDAQREGGEDGKVSFKTAEWKGTIEGDVLTGTNPEGASWKLKKTLRQSPTLGAKPPAGAVVLFDGTNADAWVGGKMDERKLLAGGTKTKQEFGSITLHLEFRTPFMPEARGQGRGNSGVYVQNRYECQVLDSFGLEGKDNEAGGIYHKAKPRLNMCFPPLSWQTYDIDFDAAQYDAEGKQTKGAIFTVKLNGVVVQDHVEIKGTTGGAALKEGPAPGPILLQNHGNPVFYRNIWVVERK